MNKLVTKVRTWEELMQELHEYGERLVKEAARKTKQQIADSNRRTGFV